MTESVTSAGVYTARPSHGATSDALSFDLRIKRDILGRRLWRQAIRGVASHLTLLTSDALGTSGAVAVGYILDPGSEPWATPLIIAFALVVSGQATAGMYRVTPRVLRPTRVVLATVWAASLLAAIDLTSPVLQRGAAWHLWFGATAVFLLLTQRFCIGQAVRYAHARGIGPTRVLIVGPRNDAWRTLEYLRKCQKDSIYICGHIALDGSRDPTTLGELTELSGLLETHKVARVVVASHVDRPALRLLAQQCLPQGVAVTVMPDLLEGLTYKDAGISGPQLQAAVPGRYVLQMILKRLLDIVGAALGLVVLLPLFAIIAVAIKLDSPGPILFRQRRPGLAGRPFGMLKFRTMIPDAERVLRIDPELYGRFLDSDCKLPVEVDPRISRVGAVLRKTSLDELPQLVNVLRGEMSLVGPRPVVGPELEKYGEWAGNLLSVKPGMTGYWQVNGRSRVGYPERADLDLHYVTEWSLALDIMILLRTIPQMLRPRGAF